ncbi:MAG TPA: hypothetical protein VMU47_00235 [Caldimonas sp.]|nr:hypothetical protein [Caldimonas sp.]
METPHDTPAPPRAVTIVTFAIALIGAVVMSLPPSEPPAHGAPGAVVSQARAQATSIDAMPAARTAQVPPRTPRTRKTGRHAASLVDVPSCAAAIDRETA